MKSEEINKFITDNYEDMTDKEMGEKVGLSFYAVKARRKSMNLEKTSKGKAYGCFDTKTELSILEQYVNSKSIKFTMDKLGLSYEVVKIVLDDYRQLGGALC